MYIKNQYDSSIYIKIDHEYKKQSRLYSYRKRKLNVEDLVDEKVIENLKWNFVQNDYRIYTPYFIHMMVYYAINHGKHQYTCIMGVPNDEYVIKRICTKLRTLIYGRYHTKKCYVD